LGHALFRKGELLRQLDAVERSVEILTEASDHFNSMQDAAAVADTEGILLRAKEALAKLK